VGEQTQGRGSEAPNDGTGLTYKSRMGEKKVFKREGNHKGQKKGGGLNGERPTKNRLGTKERGFNNRRTGGSWESGEVRRAIRSGSVEGRRERGHFNKTLQPPQKVVKRGGNS